MPAVYRMCVAKIFFQWWKIIIDFMMPIFRKIILNLGDFTHFEDFSYLTKQQIFKRLDFYVFTIRSPNEIHMYMIIRLFDTH